MEKLKQLNKELQDIQSTLEEDRNFRLSEQLQNIIDEISNLVEAPVMQKIAEDGDIKTAIEKYFDLTHNILECECDEYNGVTCGLHLHQNLSRIAKEKLSNFSA